MPKKIPEDEFYGELDKKTERKSCCSCQTMAILFFVLLIIVAGTTYYLYRKISQINFNSKVIEFTANDRTSFYDKLQAVTISDAVEIIITSEELTASFSDGLSIRNLLIKNIQAIITNDNLSIFGTLVKPLNSQINIVTVPLIKEGKIKLDVVEFNAGKLKFPKIVNNEISQSLSALMDKSFEKFYENYDVTNIELMEDKMIITGKLKD